LKAYPEVRITGVDTREPPRGLDSDRLIFKKVKYNRSQFEKIFRNNKFDYVFHLSRLSHAYPKANIMERSDINVVGTNTILELCYSHGIKKVVILSTFHVYGANPDNPFFIPESYHLRASFKYHELHDVVEMDQSTTSFMWRHRHDIETVILRPCNIIGPNIHNAMSNYLKSKISPLPIDYKPMFQFIHESDMARILQRSIEELPGGIYNVAPPDTISLNRADKILQKKKPKAPISLLGSLANLTKVSIGIPFYLIDYLKHSCVLDCSELKKHLGEEIFEYSSEASIACLSMNL
jgi:UDP-glucose 4-epimerase